MGYPHFKGFEKAPQRNRVEQLLGTMVADFVCDLLQMVLEGTTGGVQPSTKNKFYDVLDELLKLWDVSHFGSWNSERRVYEPYFADPKPENPRLNFGGAVRTYGLIELRKRFPQESDATLQNLLWWPIEMLDRATKASFPPPSAEIEELAAAVVSAIRGQPVRCDLVDLEQSYPWADWSN